MNHPTPTRPLSRRFLVIGVVFTLGWTAVLLTDIFPQLRGDYGWRWPYDWPRHLGRAIPLALGLDIYWVGARYLFKRRLALLLGWAVLGSLGLTFMSVYLVAPRVTEALYLRTLSPAATGWHFASTDLDENGEENRLKTWDEQMEYYHLFSAHVAISPPGLPLAFYGVRQAFDTAPDLAKDLADPLRARVCHDYRFNEYTNSEFASLWLGILTPLWASLTVFPLFCLGRRYFSAEAARWAVVWWPLIPAVAIFTPYPSVIYPVLGLVIVLMLLHGLYQNTPLWVLGAGFIMSGLSFLNFSTIPLIFMAGLLALGVHYQRRTERPWWWSLWMGGWFGLGLSAVWVTYYALYGLTPWQMFQTSMNVHLDLERPYLPWVFLHVYDFMFFTGWPLVLLAGYGVWRMRQSWRTPTSAVMVSGSALLTILVLDISGVGRGETGRVWMFLTPYFLLTAGFLLEQTGQTRLGWSWTALQAVVMFCIILVLRPIGTGTPHPPPPPPLPRVASAAYLPNGASFDHTLTVREFSGHLEISSEDSETALLWLWVRWEAQGQFDVPYYISILPVAPDGTPQTPYLEQGFGGDFPTTCWLPEHGIIEEAYQVPITGALEGEWWVSLALLDRQGNRVPVIGPDGTPDSQVGLGPLQVLE
jgi:hypothetical protein